MSNVNDAGLRRRRGSTKKGENNRNSTTTATAPYGHRDDDDAELDKPLIQHNNFVDSDEERNERGTHSSAAARGSLRAPDNGPWNRLSCVSFMLNNAAAASRNGAVYHKAVDVACAVIDKLPDFFSAKLGPKTLENPHKTFVDRFRESFVVTYNKNDVIHLEMVQELYRHFYAICCVDSDPLIDMSGFLSFAHPSEQTFQEKDIISSEYWKMMGFQGTNPGTDFRGGGCLSLLLLLHLFKNRPDLVRSIFVSRETAPKTPPPPRQPSPSSSTEVHYHHPPQFFVSNMENFISATNSQSNSSTGGNLFHTCEYPFAIAAINVAMHLMLLLGVERNTTCLATSENISSYSSRLAKQKVVSIVYNDNGNCTAHEEPPGSCRPFLTRMTKEAAGLHSYSSEQESQSSTAASASASSPNRLVEGFDHLAALFETCIAIMHNEWLSIPPRDRNILYFNQLLQKARAKTEFLLRHAENILEFNKEVEGYQWISH